MDAFDYIIKFVASSRKYINHSCSSLEAWQIILYSVITTLLMFYIKAWIHNVLDDGMAMMEWRFFRSLPIINRQVQKRMKVSGDEVEQQLEKGLENRKFIQSILKRGWAVSVSVLQLPVSNVPASQSTGQQRSPAKGSIFDLAPERIKMMRYQLLLIMHVYGCQPNEVRECFVSLCQRMKQALNHMTRCSILKTCPVPHCSSSRALISHWKNCMLYDCPLCLPVVQLQAEQSVLQLPVSNVPASQSTGQQSSPVPAPIFTLAPEKIKMMQQQLLIIMHVHECQPNEVRECFVLLCEPMKQALSHMTGCSIAKKCPVPYCSSSRALISHWKHCMLYGCPLCLPVKQLRLKSQEAKIIYQLENINI